MTATSATESDDTTLEFAETLELQTSSEELWSFVSKPENLTMCVPGAQSVDQRSKRKYTCEIVRGISHVTVSLSGDVELVELNEPEWVVARGSAYDSSTGTEFIGLAAMELTEVDDETTALSYSAELSFSGGLASLGTTLVNRVVQRDVKKYFGNVRAAVEPAE